MTTKKNTIPKKPEAAPVRTTITIPGDLLDTLKFIATAQNKSLNEFVVDVLADSVKRHQKDLQKRLNELRAAGMISYEGDL